MTYPVIRTHGSESSCSHHSKMIGASNVDKEEEANEMAIIVVTNAIVHPRAMVV